MADSKARNALRAYMMIFDLHQSGVELCRDVRCGVQEDQVGRDDAPSRADRPDYAGPWRMRRIPVKRSAHTRRFMKITGTGETGREAYTWSLDMGIGGTYENAPRLASTRPSSHARPGTTLAEVCCTSGVARCAAEMADSQPSTLVGAVSAHMPCPKRKEPIIEVKWHLRLHRCSSCCWG